MRRIRADGSDQTRSPDPEPRPGALRRVAERLNAAHLRRLAGFFASFGLAKLAAFATPFVLANLMSPQLYGLTEFCLSAGAIAAVVLGVGLPGAMPTLMLRANPVYVLDVAAQHVAIVAGGAGALAAGALLLWQGEERSTLVLALCLAGLATAQASLTSHLRAVGRQAWVPWAEVLPLLTVLILSIALAAAGRLGEAALGAGLCAVVLALAAGALAVARRGRRPGRMARWVEALRIGRPRVAFGLLTVWITTSPRIYTGLLAGSLGVATYAFSFRVASSLLLLHTVTMTLFFRRAFRSRTRAFDAAFALYMVGLLALAVLLVLWRREVLLLIAPRQPELAQGSDGLFPVIVLYVWAWATAALAEMRINRFHLTGAAARLGLANSFVVAAAFGALSAAGSASLLGVAWLTSLSMVAHAGSLQYLLWSRRLVMPRIAAMFAGGTVVLALLATPV